MAVVHFMYLEAIRLQTLLAKTALKSVIDTTEEIPWINTFKKSKNHTLKQKQTKFYAKAMGKYRKNTFKKVNKSYIKTNIGFMRKQIEKNATLPS